MLKNWIRRPVYSESTSDTNDLCIAGNLLYGVATRVSASTEKWKKMLAEYVANGKIASTTQLDLALAYLKAQASVEKFDTEDFHKKIGVSIPLSAF